MATMKQIGKHSRPIVENEGQARRLTLAEMQKKAHRKWIVAFLVLLLTFVAGGVCFAKFPANTQPHPDQQPEQQPAHLNSSTSSVKAQQEQTQSEVYQTPKDARSQEMALDSAKNSGWRTQTDGTKKVYLTFDDGPSENTEKILQILAENGAKATFFVTGHESDKFNLIKKEWEAGHTVGMHTYSHKYYEIYTSASAYKADLEKIGNVIKDQIGFTPFLFRFPGGSSNSISEKYCPGIMTTLTSELVAEGYQYYDWNISSGDANSDDVPADQLVSNSCQEGWTNIMLLMHDTDAKNITVEALPQIIKFYKDRGYEFCAITRTSFAVHHSVSN